MIQTKSDQDRFTAERLLRTRPKTYRAIVQLLADPDATVMHIAKRHSVSEHTVRAIRERESVAIAERKQRLVSIFGNVAEIAAERMEELAGKANLRDAGTTAGIATDKLLALSDPALYIQHDVILHRQNEQQQLIDFLKVFNLDPAVIIQDMQHNDIKPTMPNMMVAALHAANAAVEKRVKARGVELPALPPRDASVAGENAAQKES